MANRMYQLIDFLTRHPVYPKGLVFTGKERPWEVLMNLDPFKASVNIEYFKRMPPGFLKYLPLLPIQHASEMISLQEQVTPLVKSRVLGPRLGVDLYFKVEGKNPTGSFKDRGSAVELSVAKSLGAKAIILASTGNMAASCACYAAIYNMPCFVLVPEETPLEKLAQVMVFGGHIIQVKGTYNDAARLAHYIAEKKGLYLAGDYAFRLEGQKTAAFELMDQLSFQLPDWVMIPMGCGTNIAAYAKGFREYTQLGLIEGTPALIGVQAAHASAIVNSFIQHQTTIQALTSTDTIASAIAVPNPVDGIKALDAIYHSGGGAVSVSDDAILDAQHLLAMEEGLFVESASAATVAALLHSRERLPKKIVCVLTGDGLKDTHVILKTARQAPLISANEKECLNQFSANWLH